MNSKRLVLGLVPALALALCACAGESSDDSAPRNDATQADGQRGNFPVQADLIDDIRNAIGGEGAGLATGCGEPRSRTTPPSTLPTAVGSRSRSTG